MSTLVKITILGILGGVVGFVGASLGLDPFFAFVGGGLLTSMFVPWVVPDLLERSTNRREKD